MRSRLIGKAQIPLGLSRLDTTRHGRHVERVETSVSSRAVRQARHSENAWARHVELVAILSRRDVTSQVEFGLNSVNSATNGGDGRAVYTFSEFWVTNLHIWGLLLFKVGYFASKILRLYAISYTP